MIGGLLDEKNNNIIDKEKIINTWKKYVSTLFRDARTDQYRQGFTYDRWWHPQVIWTNERWISSKTRWTRISDISGQRRNKMADKNLSSYLQHRIYFLRLVIIHICSFTQKTSANQCEVYRLMNFMSHILKFSWKYVKCSVQRSPRN